MSPPDRRLPKMCRRNRWRSRRGKQVNKEGWAKSRRKTTSSDQPGESSSARAKEAHVRNHRLHRIEAGRSHPHRRAASARIPRLRFGGRRGRAGWRPSICGAARANWRASKRSSPPRRLTASTASGTRDGRRTVARPRRMHTRIATAPGRIVVVHNGIIENYLDLKQQLQKEGHTFVTETDTEIVAHLVEREMKDDGLENAVRRALLYMRGLFALVLISADDPNKIVTVRNGPPIVVGLGDGRVLRRLGHPGHPEPYARRRVSRRRGDGGDHAGGRRIHRLFRPRGLEEEHESVVGSGHGREGRIQALHAQGDFRAAVGGQGNGARPRVAGER